MDLPVLFLVAQSCPTLGDPMDCVAHQAPLSMGILQARILEWVAMPTLRGSSNPGIEPRSLAMKADSCSIPRSGRFPGERNAAHSSILAWRIPWTEEPCGLQSNKPRKHIKKQRQYLYGQSYGFSSSHVQMWELGHIKGWVQKNWCLRTVVLEKTLESPLDRKEIQPVHPKGNQSWIIIGRTEAAAETPILGPPDAKSRLIGKDPDAEKDWRQEEKGMTEDEMVGWHYHPTQWTRVWADSRRWWRTGKPGVLQSMGSQRVRYDWVTENNNN